MDTRRLSSGPDFSPDYTSAAMTSDDAAQTAIPLARMASQSHPHRYFSSSRNGKGPVRPRQMTTPSTSMSEVPTMPMPIPIAIPSNPNVIPGNTLPSAPASPPTPAPSPSPMQRTPAWSKAPSREELRDLDMHDEERRSAQGLGRGFGFGYNDVRAMFSDLDNEERQQMLADLLGMCDSKLLGFVASFVGPRLKRDPFSVLPNELCLRILTFIEDPRTLVRSSQVSRRWRELAYDQMAWKSLYDAFYERHPNRRLSDDQASSLSPPQPIPAAASSPSQRFHTHPYGYQTLAQAHNPALAGLSSSAPDLLSRSGSSLATPTAHTMSTRAVSSAATERPTHPQSYRSHFKKRYQVETAWRHGGKVDTRQITPDQGVVTSLHLTSKYIIVALDNAKIHVFDTEGRHLRCLQGHVMGVWAMVPYGDTLVSGGCDRDVRVWDLTTGVALHMLRGHSSTVRCLKMSGPNLAISGSRDMSLRVWDIRKGECRHVLTGHQASVRCLEIHGDLVVSGSYDTTARIWSISEGRCLRTLQGHFSQIYAVAFDGKRVATGSLDTSVRVWDPRDGRCLAQLQGHTSLVGQLQLRNDTLVTGGSDGSVRVWSLQTYSAIHRLAAHDNSVTSLQFDDSRIVSGGSDGRVKVWDLQRGCLIRELGNPAEAVWRVVFEEEKAVVLASRGQKTVMEVWSFAPPPDQSSSDAHITHPSASSSSKSYPSGLATSAALPPPSSSSSSSSSGSGLGQASTAGAGPSHPASARPAFPVSDMRSSSLTSSATLQHGTAPKSNHGADPSSSTSIAAASTPAQVGEMHGNDGGNEDEDEMMQDVWTASMPVQSSTSHPAGDEDAMGDAGSRLQMEESELDNDEANVMTLPSGMAMD